jgi:hypothetical protein
VTRADPLERELQRSRRFRRPLSLVRARPRADGESATLANALRAAAREVDQVWESGGAVIVVLAEADAAAARAFAGRVCRPISSQLAEPPSIATFPDDGLTLAALLETLHGLPTEHVEAPPVEAPADDLQTRVAAHAATGRRDGDRTESTAPEPSLARGRAD